MKQKAVKIFLLCIMALPSYGFAQKYAASVRLGPPSVGNGGSNPVNIPPTNVLDYELILETPEHWQYRLGVFPHALAAGKVFKQKYGFYTAIGASIVLSATGYGPGIYSSFGWRSPAFLDRLTFDADYTQDLGITVDDFKVTAPFALRIGLTCIF